MARDKALINLLARANNEKPVEQMFLDDLKNSIEKDANAGSTMKPSQTYKPSSMQCIRNMWYQVTGAEPDEGTTSYCMAGICNSGTDIHARTQGYVLNMKNNGFDCEYVNVADYVRQRGLDYLEIRKEPDPDNGDYETKLYHKTLNMSFLCDGIIRFEGKYYILELKTETCNKWYSRTGVDPKHYNQGTAYSVAFGIDNVIFVYISRDNSDMKAYMFNVTDAMKQELVGKIEECDGYVQRLICPPKPDDIQKRICNYCGYKKLCGGV